jgi:predicted DCC family thiol-disulfide oxidoreductase YuxK
MAGCEVLVYDAVTSMSRLPVLFDGGCPMCRRTVRIIRALDWNDRLQFVDATNADARAFFAPSLTEAEVLVEMYVIDERQRLHGGFEGYLQMARVVPLLWPMVSLDACQASVSWATRSTASLPPIACVEAAAPTISAPRHSRTKN